MESVEWDDIVGIEKSEEGLVGVLFVELPGKRAVVLKFLETVAQKLSAIMYLSSAAFGPHK